jgi:hypothetical protein
MYPAIAAWEYWLRYFPKRPVSYVGSSQVAKVDASSKLAKPPFGGAFVQTPVLWAY